MNFLTACIACLLIVILAGAPPAASASIFGRDNKPVQQEKKNPIHDEESFKAQAISFHQVPFNNPKYEFSILLPKDWTSGSVATSVAPTLQKDIPEDIARFKSPMIGTAQASITIQAAHLNYEISVENWLKNYALTNGYALQEKVTPLGGNKASMAYIYVHEITSTYVYTTAQINANTVIMARFEIPLYLKEPMNFLQRRTIDSFKLILVNDNPIEKQEEYRLSNAVKFFYPESWAVHYPDFRDMNNMSVHLHNETPARTVDGLIRFAAIHRNPQTSLIQEMEKTKKYFGEFLNIKFKQMISSETPALNSRFLFSRYEIYTVTSKKDAASKKEVRLAVFGDKDWYIITFLLTPPEGDNLAAWARNTRTFDMVLKSLK